MKSDKIFAGLSVSIILAVVVVFVLAIISVFPNKPKCSLGECDDEAKDGSKYCYLHDMSYHYYGNPDYHAVYEESKRKQEEKSSANDEFVPNNSSNSTNTRNSYSYSGSSFSGNDSYNDGYDDVYDNEDYDSDRYEVDDDYAMGVDDAMDELGW